MREDSSSRNVPPIEEIAHSMSNLLAAILGNAQYALRKLESNPELNECLRSIEASALRATDLARQLKHHVPEDDQVIPPLYLSPTTVIKSSNDQPLILVADDEDTIRSIADRTLRFAGYRVLIVSDGQEAVETFRQHADTIRCVLLDLTMPRMSGDQALLAIRAIRPKARVVLMSGYLDPQLRLPVDGVLRKPFSIETLEHTVQQFVESPISASHHGH